MATWYRPAQPEERAQPKTCASALPIFTVTGLQLYCLSAGTWIPAATGGVVAPNPVPQRITTSPGLAATVALLKVPFFTARLASCRVATTWLPGHRKKAGE